MSEANKNYGEIEVLAETNNSTRGIGQYVKEKLGIAGVGLLAVATLPVAGVAISENLKE